MKIPLTWKGNLMDSKTYEYETVICEADGKGGAYVAFPYDVREEFGRGREKVHVTFDGVSYDGSVVNMGVKNADGSICYIIGIKKEIRKRLGIGWRHSRQCLRRCGGNMRIFCQGWKN